MLAGAATAQPAPTHYGLIGQMKAVPGKRAELAAILLAGTAKMPGCLGYLIAEDAKDLDALWITETWDSKASHDASLSLPAVRAAIAKGRPLIAGFGQSIETKPLGDAATAAR
ncbi:putative quinol monooxygenase [Sphingomonas sp. BIUV-7]|uniref:Quinol monooxygenase n=2 Tax=Sphingomonas natans TaxID=3063330 RepID=A0ABT8YE68_9SPHN|nr:putative quinol monooxygenase [Sphingomonas sp. BIUV-7]MDO6415949.1 putative quinol monooxygenase [Sphingomonas sp. BIUV-7]